MKLKENFVAKVIAIFLFAVCLTSILLSSGCLVFGIASGAFSSKDDQKEFKEMTIKDMLWDTCFDIERALDDYALNKNDTEIELDWYIDDSPNVVYEIKDNDGNIVFSNIDVPVSDNVIETEHIFTYYITEDGSIYHNWADIPADNMDIIHDDKIDVGESETSVFGEILSDRKAVQVQETYSIKVCLKETLSEKDLFYYIPMLFDFVADNVNSIMISTVLLLITLIFLIIFICCASGHKDGIEGIHISRFDRFPVDILTSVYCGITVLMGCALFWVADDFFDDILQGSNGVLVSIIPMCIALVLIVVALDFIALALLIMSISVRLKTKTFIKTTFIYIFLCYAWKLTKKLCIGWWKINKKLFNATRRFISKLPLVWKTALGIIILAFCEVVIIIMMGSFLDIMMGSFLEEIGYLLFFVFNALLITAILFISIQLRKIKDTTKDIANGNIYRKIDTRYMFLDIKEHAENINNINDGIANAVQDRMKSERFKTELITNVSHDIKTPLTSIINYVDLLEKEEIENETANEYISVLSRQSTRLKKLVEDLIEASKASTGNISVNLTECELGILLSQALAEYDDRFAKNSLQVVINKSNDILNVMADNRHMWRVFDNILNNIAKYAQPNTRIYIDAKRVNKIAEISFRNISKEPLNISGDELMERFVRGDSSRNTEGSGLGLSIAKSLTEVQQGKLDIQIDGDLFKVRLAFPLSE